MSKDLRRLVKELERQGYVIVRRRGSGHLAVYKADGTWVTDLAQTPSEYRGWRNALAALRRAGFVWPPKR